MNEKLKDRLRELVLSPFSFRVHLRKGNTFYKIEHDFDSDYAPYYSTDYYRYIIADEDKAAPDKPVKPDVCIVDHFAAARVLDELLDDDEIQYIYACYRLIEDRRVTEDGRVVPAI